MPALKIAIDGPAASGKSTVARLVAERLGGFTVNTGDLYRAVSWAALERGLDPVRDAAGVVAMLAELDLAYRIAEPGRLRLHLNGRPVPQEAIRAAAVAAVVSHVARLPEVREWLRQRQRDCCALGTVVMEGRDIGTVILPDAPFKFFITASPMERARRRLAQPGEVAAGATVQSVAAEIAERDRIDSSRPVAPLRPADDAITINTDGLTPDEVADRVVGVIRGGPRP
ncbi:MAG: (d)CMP kinase [Lentisphaerae bacterium]|nr:(d)CMP kinase [Lentisphaerota bacterium]